MQQTHGWTRGRRRPPSHDFRSASKYKEPVNTTMNGQQMWEPQEWHTLWQVWEGQWQVFWQQWQGNWQGLFHHWQPGQQQFVMWSHHWREQFEGWKQNWWRQWGEWQVWQQHHRQSWRQHKQHWQLWQQQCQFQYQMWEQQEAWHWQRWQAHQLQQEFQPWKNQWNEQWRLWQEWWQQEQQQWHQFKLHQWHQEHQQWNANMLLWKTKRINFIRLTYVLEYNPLTRPFRCDDIDMIENTEFGCLVADGFVNELFESHKQDLSWAGSIVEEDLYISEDGSYVYIAREPTEEATDGNKILDFSCLTTVLFCKYIHNGQVMPPYLEEFIDRVARLRDKTGRDLLISLWTLRHHPFVMDPLKWRVFVEEYYKWYKATDLQHRHRLLAESNRHIYRNWHLSMVRTSLRLMTVYWHGRLDRIPDDYDDRDCDIPQDLDDDHNVYRYTTEDGYLAVFQRAFYVHGPENLQELSLKELAFLMANIFKYFLPRFIEEVFSFAEHEELPANEREMLTEALLSYTKRSSSSWRRNHQKLFEVEETPSARWLSF